MDVDEIDLTGRLLKVCSVDPEIRLVVVRVQDGRTATYSPQAGDLPVLGDVLLVDENGGLRVVSKSLWPDANDIGIVRHLDSETSALVEIGARMFRVPNPLGSAIKVNSTVEFNSIEGILGTVSDTPIRSRDHGLDEAEILKDYLVPKSENELSFDDFGGYPEVVARARELIETQIKRRTYLEAIGAKPVKGVLFTGPPGTGKTHLARIIAQESGAEFFLVSGPSIVSKWLGDTENTLRRLFQAATDCPSGRAIIFFDEIDSIAERRSSDSHEASKRLVAQLLTLMDGFDDKGKSVLVVAATNRVEVLDQALTRPGRFDWEIEFGTPTLEDRYEILRVGAKRLKSRGELPLEDVATMTDGWSAAELTSLWGEAALLAAGEERDEISAEDVALALERVMMRPRRTANSGAQT